jgi:protein-disulfide isomerase
VSVLAAGAVAIAVLTSGSTSQLAPGKPVPGAAQTVALFAGIPQRGATLGDPRAPVTLVEFGDLQCPVCSAYAENALPTIIARYVRAGQVRLVFRNLDSIGSDSVRAARMAGALGEQNHMWEFIDLMYKNQGAENTSYVTDRYLKALAAAIPGVQLSRALRERASTAVRAQLRQAHEQAQQLHLQSTPSFVIAGGSQPEHVLPSTDLSSASLTGPIDQALAGARRSALAGARRSALAGARSSTLAGARRSALAGARSSMLAGARSSMLAGARSSMLAGARSSMLAGARSSMLAGARRSGR